jgi:Tol biopolymer transport system component
VRDTVLGTTTRVSVDSDGAQANNSSFNPSLSADGRYIAFYSDASNLVAGDTNGTGDIFVRDTVDGTTTRVSVDSDEAQANSSSSTPALSSDGRYIVFSSSASNLVADDTNVNYDIFVRDTVLGTTTRVSVDSDGAQANNSSFNPSLSADGRYIAFYSNASNLVADDTNGTPDIFIVDGLEQGWWFI